ncbi:hypothetical protein PCANC_02167 [Puccinia coronata f. sp. avenae]|uniref:Uncharacterized protein n=1 Tax=Puccinia coronata f. sp. avenae TaxID=200324 RepID=A0A2N5U833_9BASI|nr:hypothetical protein PCASD_13882 [Puccinia coronata f. sp. avenae]PLW55555.1 hypothetical protein PCANC_02167 [Puccinia coronata f. sp. avenae]
MSNKPGLMGLSNMGSDNCVRSSVEQQCSMSLSDMGSNRWFDPMSDNICLMSFYSLDRLFDSFESVAEQAGSDLLGRTCSDIFAEQANDLLGKELANSRPACCELAG